MTIIVNIVGLLLIFAVVWWFWLSEAPSVPAKLGTIVQIRVKDGIYQPAHITVKANEPITLRFIREDVTSCAETVVFDALNISLSLPLNQAVDIAIPPLAKGNYDFTCQMGMYRGKLVVN